MTDLDVEKDLIKKKKLRTGFTTGTCATAGAVAGILGIINQENVANIDVVLPRSNMINIKMHDCKFGRDWAKCSVIKDGGDDPDVTHGAEIVTEISLTKSIGKIDIDGGIGVGIVTKPGLGLEINKPAINPVPKKMIIENLFRVAKYILENNGIKVIISVPKGKEIGPKTDNPRLGILGGISILGTSGIVIPFSTASYAASIRQNLDLVLAVGDKDVVLATGSRSEDFAKKIINWPDHCFIQMGDFSGYTIQQCAKKGITKVIVVGFIGKLAKMAMGIKQTHVKGSKVDMNFLAELAKKSGASESTVQEIRKANTARHVLEIINQNHILGFFDEITSLVQYHMREYSKGGVAIEVILFSFDGIVLSRI